MFASLCIAAGAVSGGLRHSKCIRRGTEQRCHLPSFLLQHPLVHRSTDCFSASSYTRPKGRHTHLFRAHHSRGVLLSKTHKNRLTCVCTRSCCCHHKITAPELASPASFSLLCSRSVKRHYSPFPRQRCACACVRQPSTVATAAPAPVVIDTSKGNSPPALPPRLLQPFKGESKEPIRQGTSSLPVLHCFAVRE